MPRDLDLDRAVLLFGDCRERLAILPDNSVDSCLTDPPYELGFMAKAWDRTGVAFDPATWAAVLRVLKPGGHMLCFGGSRTYHRIAVAIEDAGFEIRDCLSWLYGTGFPKYKALDDARTVATALKPAWEPIILARKPVNGSVTDNFRQWGTGGLWIDACRLGREDIDPSREGEQPRTNGVTSFRPGAGPRGGSPSGRFPSNVHLDEEAAEWLDAQTAHLGTGGSIGKDTAAAAAARSHAVAMNPHMAPRGEWKPYGDRGGASRFFYVAKTNKKERNLYCEHLPERSGGEATDREDGSAGVDNPRAGAGRTGGSRNFHPTVKPAALLRYLARLITPPAGLVLDPFTGSGSTAIPTLMDGYRFIGVEQSAEYLPIATARITGAHDRPEQARTLLDAP